MKIKYFIYAALGLGLLALIPVFKRMFSFGGILDFSTPAQENLAAWERDLQNLDLDTSKLTYDKFNLAMRADNAYMAMHGLGTNEKLLFEQFEGLPPEDLKYIAFVFGNKKDTLFGIPIFEGNIFNWFNAELSGKDLQRMKEIWKDTGIWG